MSSALDRVLKDFTAAAPKDELEQCEAALGQRALFAIVGLAVSLVPLRLFLDEMYGPLSPAVHDDGVFLALACLGSAYSLSKAYARLCQRHSRSLFDSRLGRLQRSMPQHSGAKGKSEQLRVDRIALANACSAEGAAYAMCLSNVAFLGLFLFLALVVVPFALATMGFGSLENEDTFLRNSLATFVVSSAAGPATLLLVS